HELHEVSTSRNMQSVAQLVDQPGAPVPGLTRRAVLQGGALLLSAAIFPKDGTATTSVATPSLSISAWVKIGRDNAVTLVASQSEMGQGATTTLAAALADELYLQLDGVKIEFSPFHPAYRDPVYNWMFTGNSQSTSSFYDIMRRMGAAAREMLISAAASRWGAAAADI